MSASELPDVPWEAIVEPTGKFRPIVGNVATNTRIADVGDAGLTAAQRKRVAKVLAAAPEMLEVCLLLRRSGNPLLNMGQIAELRAEAARLAKAALKKAGVL